MLELESTMFEFASAMMAGYVADLLFDSSLVTAMACGAAFLVGKTFTIQPADIRPRSKNYNANDVVVDGVRVRKADLLFNLDSAVSTADIEYLRWINDQSNKIGTVQAILTSIRYGHINVLRWLYRTHNVYRASDYPVIDVAVAWNKKKTLEWLISMDLKTRTPDALVKAIENRNLDIVKVLVKHFYDDYDIDHAIQLATGLELDEIGTFLTELSDRHVELSEGSVGEDEELDLESVEEEDMNMVD